MLMKRLRLALLVGGGALGAVTADATSLKRLSFSDMVDEANIVVVGQATSARTVVTAEGVVTITSFKVADSIVGGQSGQIDIVTPGGSFKPGKFRVSESTADTPFFAVGKDMLLFLDPAVGGDFQIVGFSQGAINVIQSAGEKMVRLPEADRDESLSSARTRIRAEKARGRKRGDVQSDD